MGVRQLPASPIPARAPGTPAEPRGETRLGEAGSFALKRQPALDFKLTSRSRLGQLEIDYDQRGCVGQSDRTRDSCASVPLKSALHYKLLIPHKRCIANGESGFLRVSFLRPLETAGNDA